MHRKPDHSDVMYVDVDKKKKRSTVALDWFTVPSTQDCVTHPLTGHTMHLQWLWNLCCPQNVIFFLIAIHLHSMCNLSLHLYNWYETLHTLICDFYFYFIFCYPCCFSLLTKSANALRWTYNLHIYSFTNVLLATYLKLELYLYIMYR